MTTRLRANCVTNECDWSRAERYPIVTGTALLLNAGSHLRDHPDHLVQIFSFDLEVAEVEVTREFNRATSIEGDSCSAA